MEEREREAANSRSKEKTRTIPSEPEEGGAGGNDGADKIDVCSDNFDPLLALYSPSVPIPCPNVKCFNNVAEYESFLRGGRGRAKPENVEKKRLKAMKGVPDLERIERLKKLMVNNPVPDPEEGASSGAAPRGKRRLKPQKNVLTRMPLCRGSPLGELFRCVEERLRVKVHIRTFKGLRGVCSGFVVAFDKFWNMALVDVDETYREPLLGEAIYHEKALTVTRLFERLKLQETSGDDEAAAKLKAQKQSDQHHHQRPQAPHTSAVTTTQDKASLTGPGPGAPRKSGPQKYGKVHTRHVNQLFIRGENVILVNPQPV